MTNDKEHLTDEELFVGDPNEGFWAAKKLSPRRAVRFHHWLAGVLGKLAQAIGGLGEGEEVDWPDLLARLAGALDEGEFVEFLSIASGHTAEEIEAHFDYGEALRCLADFVEINRIGSVVADFFARARGKQEKPARPVATGRKSRKKRK